MNPWQVEQQLAYLLTAAVWPDAPGNNVFSKVIVSAKPAEDFYGRISTPFAVVRRTNITTDPEHPERYPEATFSVQVLTENWSDYTGAGPVTGATVESIGSPGGRGADELLEAAHRALSSVDASSGIQTRAYIRDGFAAAEVGTSVATATLEVAGLNLTRDRYYHPPYRFLVTGAAGAVTLSWVNAANRYDLVGTVIRYQSGAAAPASVTAGLAAPGFSGGLVTTFGFSPGAGQWSFALFQSYDEFNSPPATPQRYSAGVNFTITV